MSAQTKERATAILRGKVVRITLRRLASGSVRHDTRLEFEPGQWARSVRLTGHLPAYWESDWRDQFLLLLMERRYEVGMELPEPTWTADSKGCWA